MRNERKSAGKAPKSKQSDFVPAEFAEEPSLSPPVVDEAIQQLAMATVAAAVEKKAVMPVMLDVSRFGTYTDYIVIVSGRSDRHVSAIADGVTETMKKTLGARALGVEGSAGGQWVLVDFGGVVVHVFYHPLREFYDLEGLWLDAPRVPLTVPDEALIPPTFTRLGRPWLVRHLPAATKSGGRGWYGICRLSSSGPILTYQSTLRLGPAGALGNCRTIHDLYTG